MATSYNVLEPSFTQSLGLQKLEFNANSPVSLLATTSFLYTVAIAIIFVVAGFKYMEAGVWRIQASEAAVTKSNKAIRRVTLGLLGVLAIPLIAFTFNRGLWKGDVGLEELRDKTKGSTMTNTVPTTQTPPPSSSDYTARKASHEAVVARLAPLNIHTNRNDVPCTEAQFKEAQPKCTSLAYLPEQTAQLLIDVNSSCRCTLVVSGATEPGHALNGSHGERRRAVDLRISASKDTSDPLYSFIKSAGSPMGESSNCYARYSWHGYTFCDEKPRGNSTWAAHFHVD